MDPGRITPRIAAVPGDLLRHEMLVTGAPAANHVIDEILDEVFLPLILRQQPTGR